MPAQALPTVAQMTEITNAIHALIAAIVLGAAGFVGAYFYQWKIYLPRQFKLRDEERTAQIEAAKKESENKAAAAAVDIERERMLPKLFEATISMSQNINQAMLQNAQQTSLYIAQLTEHDKRQATNTTELVRLSNTVDTAIINIQLIKEAVDANTDHSKTAAAYSKQATETAQETLEFVKREINKMVGAKKSDTADAPPVTDADAKADAPPLEDVA